MRSVPHEMIIVQLSDDAASRKLPVLYCLGNWDYLTECATHALLPHVLVLLQLFENSPERRFKRRQGIREVLRGAGRGGT